MSQADDPVVDDLGDEEPLADWEQELLAASAPEAEKLDAEQAAARLRRALKKAPPPEATRAPAVVPDFVAAQPPYPLHEITFPVYDRKAKGFRIIQRAFGTREVKLLLKALLDSFVGTAEQVDSARKIDVTGHLHAAERSIDDIAIVWKCSRGQVHDARWIAEVEDGTIPGGQLDVARRTFYEHLDRCLNYEDTNSRDYDASKFRMGRTYQMEDALDFVHSHAPFITVTSSGKWQVALPVEVALKMWIPQSGPEYIGQDYDPPRHPPVEMRKTNSFRYV